MKLNATLPAPPPPPTPPPPPRPPHSLTQITCTHWLIDSLTHTFTQSLTHSLTHSRTHCIGRHSCMLPHQNLAVPPKYFVCLQITISRSYLHGVKDESSRPVQVYFPGFILDVCLSVYFWTVNRIEVISPCKSFSCCSARTIKRLVWHFVWSKWRFIVIAIAETEMSMRVGWINYCLTFLTIDGTPSQINWLIIR